MSEVSRKVTPLWMAWWMRVMLLGSDVLAYPEDMFMHPNPWAETSKPCEPSFILPTFPISDMTRASTQCQHSTQCLVVHLCLLLYYVPLSPLFSNSHSHYIFNCLNSRVYIHCEFISSYISILYKIVLTCY